METVEDLYESTKFSGRRRVARWGVKTSNTVRQHPEYLRAKTKREHNSFVLMNRDEELKANGTASALGYREFEYYSSAEGWDNVRRAPVTDIGSGIANINHHTASSVVHYSVDKRKNWETIEAAKKAQQRRMALTRSYSDTDELESSSQSSDDDDGDEQDIPKVAVIEREAVVQVRGDQVGFGQVKIGEAFVSKSTQNRVLDEGNTTDGEDSESSERYVVSTGRKGRVVRDKRPKGKKGVIKPRMANQHSRFIQDLATADTLIAVAKPMDRSHHSNHAKYNEFICCKICNPPKANAHKRDNSGFKKKLLDEL
eukprot:TRINITY_DN8506_c0_g1_i1.p1 TRINITY_DN8506_c0_g1~~TRINITY_DN8506_c0_g1_i1.p1  ORF type:complete len:312 (-),score=67.23 TRINITY_DN8506_c0_g1_i1:260-1195(-)